MAAQRIVPVVGAAIVRGREVLAARRGPTMASPGLWEFPGGKIESAETPEAALAREILEELGVVITIDRWLARGTADLDNDARVVLDVFAAHLRSEVLRPIEHDRLLWLDASQLETVPWTRADLPVLPALRDYLRQT
jgi:8-oxo-dGTP diphosphatase